jgi:2-polyprenyl-6-methoxyphenol hydroxylase-like FAD-dependent oxidoreductase
MMTGFLLARAGVDVLVLEKHSDFLRDFRGDTVHPSTLEVMHELGILDDFLRLPHQEVRTLGGQVGGDFVSLADFSHLPTRCRFIALVPQWEFLDFIARKARRYTRFQLRMETEVVDLLEENGRIMGVRAETKRGPLEVRADLTIGADGRGSALRQLGKLRVDTLGAPMDVLWFRLTRRPEDGQQTLGRIVAGKMMVLLNREDYWQCAYLIRKGDVDSIRGRGLQAFREDIASVSPFLRGRVDELKSWDEVKLLTVRVDRLRQWYRNGLLLIGDAAHAMSPIGGVGINLAIQDAVATANLLTPALLRKEVLLSDLERLQRRRQFPTRITQGVQVLLQNGLISRVLGNKRQIPLPWPLKLLRTWPFLRRIPARLIGVGFRAERVQTPEANP